MTRASSPASVPEPAPPGREPVADEGASGPGFVTRLANGALRRLVLASAGSRLVRRFVNRFGMRESGTGHGSRRSADP